MQGIERKVRNVVNRKMEERFGPLLDKLYQISESIDTSSPEYIDFLVGAGQMMTAFMSDDEDPFKDITGLSPWKRSTALTAKILKRILPLGGAIETEINAEEDNRLQKLIDSDEACIFVINHDDQIHDPIMLATFASMLYRGYDKAGKAATCPRPKIILNEDILNSQGKKLRTIFQKLGAVGVDASVSGKDKAARDRNREALTPVVAGFMQDQNHIFIFPEGRNATGGNRPLEEKFQRGIGRIVSLAARGKKRVKVVPLGFAYGRQKNDSLGSIHIGEPVYFVPKGRQMYVNVASVDQDSASNQFRYYFHDEKQLTRRDVLRAFSHPAQAIEEANNPLPPQPKFFAPPAVPYETINGEAHKIITHQGKPAVGPTLADCIAHALCENLRICREKAIQKLPKESLGEEVKRC